MGKTQVKTGGEKISMKEAKSTLSKFDTAFRQLQNETFHLAAMTESQSEDQRRNQIIYTALGSFDIPYEQIKTYIENNQVALEGKGGRLALRIVTISLSPIFDLGKSEQQDELIKQHTEHEPLSEMALAVRSDPDDINQIRKHKSRDLRNLLSGQIVPNLHPYQIAIPIIVRRENDEAQTSIDGQLAIVPGKEYARRLQKLADIIVASCWVKALSRLPFNDIFSLGNGPSISSYYPLSFQLDRILRTTPYIDVWEKAGNSQNHDPLSNVDYRTSTEEKAMIRTEIQKLCKLFHVKLDIDRIPGFFQEAKKILRKNPPDVLTTPFTRAVPIPKLPIANRAEKWYQEGIEKMRHYEIDGTPPMISPYSPPKLTTLVGFFQEYAKARGDIHLLLDQDQTTSHEKVYGLASWPYNMTISVNEIRLSRQKKGSKIESPLTETEVIYEIAKATQGFQRVPQLPGEFPLAFKPNPDEMSKLVDPHPNLFKRAQVLWSRHRLRQEEKK